MENHLKIHNLLQATWCSPNSNKVASKKHVHCSMHISNSGAKQELHKFAVLCPWQGMKIVTFSTLTHFYAFLSSLPDFTLASKKEYPVACSTNNSDSSKRHRIDPWTE